MYVVRKYSGLYVMYCIVCRRNPSFSLHNVYAEGAQLNTTPLVRAVACDITININNTLPCGKYEQKGTIHRRTMELKLIKLTCAR